MALPVAPVAPSPSPLGILTGFASTLNSRAFLAPTLARYYLQAVSRSLLPGEARLCICCRRLAPKSQYVSLRRSADRSRVRYGNLMRCGSVWLCPVCASVISQYKRDQLSVALRVARSKSLAVYLETRTFRHHRWHKVDATLSALNEADRLYTAGRGGTAYMRDRFGFVGSVTALEVTYGENGWHSHKHTLLFVPAEESPSDLEAYRRPRWRDAGARFGLDTSHRAAYKLDATNDAVSKYLAKFGHEPTKQPWAAEDELTKSHVKRGRVGHFSPRDLLWIAGAGDDVAAALYREYALAFKGRHQLQWSPDLRRYLGLDDVSDQAIADGAGTESYSNFALLSAADWSVILASDARGEVEAAARLVSFDEFAAWLGDVFGIVAVSPA